MIFRNLFFLLLSFISLSSCSFFSQKIDTLALANQTQSNEQIISKLSFCSEKTKYQFLTEDEATQKFYKSLEVKLFQKEISFVQKGIMMALIELIRRPDLISPSSRLQIYMKLENKNYYFDFRPTNLEDDTKYSYTKGLEYLAKNFLAHQNLQSISSLLDSFVPQQILVSQDFENFLNQHRSELQNNELMTSRFFKGDETITRYETFHRMSFKNITNFFNRPEVSSSESYERSKNPLLAIKSNPGVEIKCNTSLEYVSNLSDEILSS